MTEFYACQAIVKIESKRDQTFVPWHIPLDFDQWLVSFLMVPPSSIQFLLVTPCHSH